MVANAIQDPFLQRLVRKDMAAAKKVSQKAKELMKDAPEVEKELIMRAEYTKEHLAQLFDLQESYHKRLTDCLQLAGQNADQHALQTQVGTKLLVTCPPLRCSLLREELALRPLLHGCMLYTPSLVQQVDQHQLLG